MFVVQVVVDQHEARTLGGGSLLEGVGERIAGLHRGQEGRQFASVCGERGAPRGAPDRLGDAPRRAAAGLGIAFNAKPAVRAQAHVAINEGGLDRLLEVLT